MAPASSPSAAFNPLLISSSPSSSEPSRGAPRLANIRVLVVGAGGIGCEVCKDLLLAGFRRLCVVDLDTIDVSNLNRQFFFRNAHVGMSKASVLASSCAALLSSQERCFLLRKRTQALRRLQEGDELEEEGSDEESCAGDLERRNKNVGGRSRPSASGLENGADHTDGGDGNEAATGEDTDGVCIDGRTVWGVVGQRMNILSSSFTVHLLQTYDFVISALDNQKARRHLNGLCIAADVPLIEAGSTGYSGQVIPIMKNETLCYDCEAKPRDQQRFPICTLRQRPERPEHCIAWAKMIYELLFGVEDNENLLTDLKEQLRTFLSVSSLGGPEGTDGKTANADGGEATQASPQTSVDQGEVAVLSRKMMKELFHDQIAELIKLSKDNEEATKKHHVLPVPLGVAGLTDEASSCCGDDEAEEATGEAQGGGLESQRVWSIRQCQEVFERSFAGLLERQRKAQREPEAKGSETSEEGTPFDKDDDLAMDFVAAAANLRMFNFHIPRKSRWAIQAIAGSIIPAIAATNAVVGSLQVVQLLHLLQFLHSEGRLRHAKPHAPNGEEKVQAAGAKTLRDNCKCRYVWVKPFVTGVRPQVAGRLILPEVMDPPKSTCFVCQQQTVTIELASLSAWSVETFVERIVKVELGLAHPYVDSESRNLYDADDVEERRRNKEDEGEASAMKQPLTEFGLFSGSMLTATDFSRGDFQCNLLLVERDLGEKAAEDPQAFRLVREGGVSAAADAVPQAESTGAPQSAAEENVQQEQTKGVADQDEDDIAETPAKPGRRGTKRHRTEEAQVVAESGVAIVVLDEDEEELDGAAAKKQKENAASSSVEAEIIIDDDDE
ncbi:ThiF family protein [Besnoitia besnoiti]|uniref:ThiF family protein n=1 Tax=Besnoitia besnoiti TaxID=94643 RepID=A0A2A9MFG9_BESBE|nr:ThiF family protein [Besnoitia besnoiti]PFH34142.1 ThiF family protein [Besnoitia besnoiti]